jgi:hypothetical protein
MPKKVLDQWKCFISNTNIASENAKARFFAGAWRNRGRWISPFQAGAAFLNESSGSLQ